MTDESAHRVNIFLPARRALLCSCAAFVVACGGGGESAPATTPPPVVTPPVVVPPPVADTTAPTVALSAPADLASGLSGVIAVGATAADNVGVAWVEFQIDAMPIGAADTSAPYAASVDTSAYPAGQHVLRARASDAAGNLSPWTSALVQFGGGATQPSGFTRNESWVTGLTSATAFTQAPDGRIFIAQQGGALRVVKNGALLATPFATVAVDSAGERGLIGVALHPSFASNGWVYIYSTRAAGGVSHNRISRFTAAGDVAAAGSEVALVDLPNLSGATNHNGGGMHFGADGKLYVGVGDNANGAQAQNLALPFGKLLRFNDDGTIPGDNPFAASQSGLGRAVWAYGLRNPYTFAVQPGTGTIHINDVGESTWEEIDVGSAGCQLRLARVRRPGQPRRGSHRAAVRLPAQRRQSARLGHGRILQGLRHRRRRVLSGQRPVSRRLPRPVLLRRLRQQVRRPNRPRQRQRRVRVRQPLGLAGRSARRQRRRRLCAHAQRRDADQRALRMADRAPVDSRPSSSSSPAVASLSGCAAPPIVGAGPRADDFAQLTRQADAWDKAIVRKDGAAIAANMADDFRQIDSDGDLETKASFVAVWTCRSIPTRSRTSKSACTATPRS